MEICLAKAQNNELTFSVNDDATSIFRAVVPQGARSGDLFTITYGDSHYVPERTVSAPWLGSSSATTSSIGDLKTSIKASEAYLGLSKSSDRFYEVMAEKFCGCTCNSPVLADLTDRKLLAVDLEAPDYARNSSRMIVYGAPCGACRKPLTYGRSMGSFCTTGLKELKAQAVREAGQNIAWRTVITSLDKIGSE